MKIQRKWLWTVGLVLLVALTSGGVVAYRTWRVYNVATEVRAQVRYLIENGGTIGEAPAAQTFSVDYLQAIFGDNPDLLEQIKSVVTKGVSDEPALNLGEVAAMVVTYHLTDEGKAEDVVVHAVGGFPLSRDKPQFHRDGYFFQQLDPNLWSWGNILIGFLGRDMIMFAADEATTAKQRELFDTLFSGEIMPLVDWIARPTYFTAVFPEPKNLFPQQMRSHVQAVIMKGSLSHTKGHWEAMVLTPSAKSAGYALSILRDMKVAGEFALKTRWGGEEKMTPWGKVIDPWWAYETVQTLERSTLEKEQGLIRMQTDFERVMVNVVLKGIERMGRDLAQMQGSMSDRLDPREVDARMKTKKPMNYWSEPHRWGPDWPIGGPTNETPAATASDQTPPVSASTTTGQLPAVAATTP
ncbi:MAG TPA: hypothetical protein PLE77_11235 [Kiritimatiellia bacterium]|nr:hypothetical protein [Kiritimatiellia bacterium]